jgi:hypothetical protein
MNSQKNSTRQDRMLPASVAAVLRIRDSEVSQCPEEILRRIDSLKIGKVVSNIKASAVSPINTNSTASNSMHNSSSSSSLNGGAWRSNRSQPAPNGFRQSSSWEKPLSIRRTPSDISSSREDESPYRRFRSPQSSPSEGAPSPAFPPGGRYVSSIVSDKRVEDRIIGHIRSKLNKFSANNYDSVKSFLEQIMNSGETDFLTEFMDMLFTKAAAEDMYCELYSRLLLELSQKFPHLLLEISKIYSNFITIFQEARDIPDQGSEDYKKFLEAQQRKKFRNGYSHFLAEIYNRNLLPDDAIEITIKLIMESLAMIETDLTNTLLVEEYLVSLHKMISTIKVVKSSPYPPYIDNMIDALKKIISKPKEETIGYNIKARFKIMDILDLLPNY